MRRLLLTSLLVIASLVALVWADAAGSRAARQGTSRAEPRLINAFGLWTLRRLGYGDLDLPVDAPKTTASASFRLPASARQGNGHWYVMHVHFRLLFAPDTGPGFVLLSANTNGWASYQVKFYPALGNGVLRIPWATLDLINGLQKHVAKTPKIEFKSANYMQYRGIRPGLSTWNFQLEQFGQAKVAAVRIFQDSAIELTRIGFGRMGLAFKVVPAKINEDSNFVIRYRLRHIGGRVLRRVSLAPELVDCPGVRLLGPRVVRFTRVAKAVSGGFRFHADAPGRCRIFFWAHSNSHNPAKEVDIVVHPAGDR
ncbi:MAG TPA: hypothetical protein VE596_12830 [Gaiellaceae bacterium]|jgi:hypothetical protein|nr:hypothetical protein [Gaiellaceae bacterium]